jgi:hypothetical protein
LLMDVAVFVIFHLKALRQKVYPRSFVSAPIDIPVCVCFFSSFSSISVFLMVCVYTKVADFFLPTFVRRGVNPSTCVNTNVLSPLNQRFREPLHHACQCE